MSPTLPSLVSAANQLALFIPTGKNDPEWLDNPALTKEFTPATLDTLAMVFFATVFTVLIGLSLGPLLMQTGKSGLTSNRSVYQFASAVANVARPFSFLIGAIVFLPLTRLIVGTTLEWQAIVVPLVILFVSFFACPVGSSVPVADMGKIEAAQMMGASNRQIRWGVQVREVAPALVQSTTTLATILIGYFVVAGALGSGGLGQMATNYDYSHFQDDVMTVTVLAIIVTVQIVQIFGDMISRLVDHCRGDRQPGEVLAQHGYLLPTFTHGRGQMPPTRKVGYHARIHSLAGELGTGRQVPPGLVAT